MGTQKLCGLKGRAGPLGPAAQKGRYLLRVQPSQPHCLQPGHRDQSKKSGSQKDHLHSPRGAGTLHSRPRCTIPTRKQFIFLSALVWVATSCLDIIPIFLKAKLLRVEEGTAVVALVRSSDRWQTREAQEPVPINSTVPILCLSTPSSQESSGVSWSPCLLPS